MSELSNSELRRLDLTLLLVFLGLLRHRKARDVADELGLTQSAISQALKRLRDIFEDELFLRRPHGMEPTATALALENSVTQAVDALRGALGAVREFDPATAEGIVRIAALDAEQAVLVPPLSARLQRLAPGIRLSILPLGREAAIAALEDGRADLAVGFIWEFPSSIAKQALYEETFLVAGSGKAMPDAPKIGLDAYCAADHILVSPGGDLRGIVDERLDAMGRRRNLQLVLPAFLPALAAASASGALVTLPSRVAIAFAGIFGLTTATPPLELRSFPISLYRHRRNRTNPKIDWLHEQFEAAATGQTER